MRGNWKSPLHQSAQARYNASMQDIRADVQALMEQNRRTADGHIYTVPSPELYPFQWLWDSCFHTIILSHFDTEAAKAELRSLCTHILPSGLIPHIIYWKHDVEVKNWGREMRGDVINNAWGVEGTSAITQPPLFALAAWRVYEQDGDTAFLKELYPIFKTHFNRLLAERRLNEESPLFIINPDESGEDNSPRFDTAQQLPPQHSTDQSLDRRLDRIYEHAKCDFDTKTCMAKHFAVADVPFNIIALEGLEYMARIAEVLAHEGDVHMFRKHHDTLQSVIMHTLCAQNECRSYDHLTNTYIDVDTWARFMPLYGGLLSKKEARKLVDEHLKDADRFWSAFPVCTTARTESAFDALGGFWRGPIWFGPNWFIYKGLKRYGFDDVAEELKVKSIALIEKSGFREQYHPDTGEGQGAHDFTWGGLVIDME